MPFASLFMVACLALTTQEAQQYPEITTGRRILPRLQPTYKVTMPTGLNNANWYYSSIILFFLRHPPSPVFGNFVECVTGMQRWKGVFINGQTEL